MFVAMPKALESYAKSHEIHGIILEFEPVAGSFLGRHCRALGQLQAEGWNCPVLSRTLSYDTPLHHLRNLGQGRDGARPMLPARGLLCFMAFLRPRIVLLFHSGSQGTKQILLMIQKWVVVGFHATCAKPL